MATAAQLQLPGIERTDETGGNKKPKNSPTTAKADSLICCLPNHNKQAHSAPDFFIKLPGLHATTIENRVYLIVRSLPYGPDVRSGPQGWVFSMLCSAPA